MDEGSYEARKSARADRVAVTMRAERRRQWNSEEKLSIVRETLRPGAVAQVVADQHGIGTGLLYTWRKQMLTAAMTGFAAVELVPEPQPPPLLAASAAAGEDRVPGRGVGAFVPEQVWLLGQFARAGIPSIGSSLIGAMVSSVM